MSASVERLQNIREWSIFYLNLLNSQIVHETPVLTFLRYDSEHIVLHWSSNKVLARTARRSFSQRAYRSPKILSVQQISSEGKEQVRTSVFSLEALTSLFYGLGR
jgi:hypothetical protein